MLFVGSYDHTIDTKNRLSIPAAVRSQLQRDAGAGEGDPIFLYVTLGEENSLAIYTERGFEKRAQELEQSTVDPELLLRYERLLYSQSERVEMDKQGRVRIPDHLLQRAKLGTEVTMLGVGDHLEVRDRDPWKETLERDWEEYRRNLFVNPRRIARGGVAPNAGNRDAGAAGA